MVLRVALLESEGNSSFCLLRNISGSGVQVKLFGTLRVGAAVSLRVGDEDDFEGHAAWVRDGAAGIKFRTKLKADALLKVLQRIAPNRRRASPRMGAALAATLTVDGRIIAARVRDISTSGARITTRTPIELGKTVLVGLPGLATLHAYVRWTDGVDVGVLFQHPIPVPMLAQF